MDSELFKFLRKVWCEFDTRVSYSDKVGSTIRNRPIAFYFLISKHCIYIQLDLSWKQKIYCNMKLKKNSKSIGSINEANEKNNY